MSTLARHITRRAIRPLNAKSQPGRGLVLQEFLGKFCVGDFIVQATFCSRAAANENQCVNLTFATAYRARHRSVDMATKGGDRCQLGNAVKLSSKLTAGSTFPSFLNENDTCEGRIPSPNTWSLCDPNSFNLRVGPDYNKNKRKEPSSAPLMEIVGVE